MNTINVHSKVGTVVLLCATVLLGSDAVAQTYPTGPVKLIVPVGAGVGPDVNARIVANSLSRSWGQPVLVVNYPGGGGAIGLRAAGTAAPDGSTLYLAIASNFVTLPE